MYIKYESAHQVAKELAIASDAADTKSWLICISDQHGESLTELFECCTQMGVEIHGAIFPGLINGTNAETKGLVARPIPKQSLILSAKLTAEEIIWHTKPPEVQDISGFSSILFMDSLSPNISGLLEELFNRYGSKLNHYGAGSGYHDLRPAPTVFSNNEFLHHGALLILTHNHSTVRARHGWRRTSGPFVASRTEGNVIQELNWEPAGSFYHNLVVEQNPDYADLPIFPEISSTSPLCIAKEGAEDVVRDPIRITELDEISLLSDVAENSIMYLASGNHQSLIAAAKQAVDECGSPDDVEHCFVSDCYSRVLMLDNKFQEELDTINTALGSFTDVKPEGVFAFGEIANNGYSFLELFNKTVVIALTHR